MNWEDWKQKHVHLLVGKFGISEAKSLLRILSQDLQINPFEIDSGSLQILDKAIEQLLQDVPIQYITGIAYFYDISLQVNRHVLIPRPETEELVELILKSYAADADLKILDIGTGSGCIPIVIKRKWPKVHIAACDISPEALDVARGNAGNYQVNIDFIQCDFLNQEERTQKLSGPWDIIVSNPPYIPVSELPKMGKNVVEFEPHLALFTDDSEGLTFYTAISEFAKNHLTQKGSIYLEMNEFHSDKIEDLFLSTEMKTNIIHDLSGKPRMLQATWLNKS